MVVVGGALGVRERWRRRRACARVEAVAAVALVVRRGAELHRRVLLHSSGTCELLACCKSREACARVQWAPPVNTVP